MDCATWYLRSSCRQLIPRCLSAATRPWANTFHGRPTGLPVARAFARPALVRSEIRIRSCCTIQVANRDHEFAAWTVGAEVRLGTAHELHAVPQ